MLLVATFVAALLTSPAGVSPGAAQVTDDDLAMLDLD